MTYGMEVGNFFGIFILNLYVFSGSNRKHTITSLPPAALLYLAMLQFRVAC